MDEDREGKRHEQIARNLAEVVVIIHRMLMNLDRIGLHLHMEADDMRERIAEDFLMVARDVLQTVDAPDELLALARTVLIDWVIANDLVSFMQARGVTPRRLLIAEEVSNRIGMTLVVLRDAAPDLFRQEDE